MSHFFAFQKSIVIKIFQYKIRIFLFNNFLKIYIAETRFSGYNKNAKRCKIIGAIFSGKGCKVEE